MQEGQVLSGRFTLLELLGAGGMGEVWRARDGVMDRIVAVKVLRNATEPEFAERFLREARLAGRLQHPGIAVVHDTGSDDGHPFIVMELLDGRDLAAVLRESPDGVPAERAVSLAIQAAQALQAAHDQGIVHRDLTPGNLFLTAGGQLKICDFGIARGLGDLAEGLTAPGVAIGTPAYMAPEQCAGAPVDNRTDLYTLGCVLYALLTGRPPFTGWPDTVIRRHITEEPEPLRTIRPDVPPALDRLVSRLLAKEPAARPATASEVAAALTEIAATLGPARSAPADAQVTAPHPVQPSTLPPVPRPGPPAGAEAATGHEPTRDSLPPWVPDPVPPVPSRGQRGRVRSWWIAAAAVLAAGGTAGGIIASLGGPPTSRVVPPTRSASASVSATAATTATGGTASSAAAVPASNSVSIDSPASGTSVQHCDVFTGRASLPASYTLVLVMEDLSNRDKMLYLQPVHDWQHPAKLSRWTGFQYFGTDDLSVGEKYTVQAVMVPIATVAAAMANPAYGPVSNHNWHAAVLPQGSVTGPTVSLTRVKGTGPAACN